MKRIWVSRLAAVGRAVAIVPRMIAATVLRMRSGEGEGEGEGKGKGDGSMGGSRAQARRRRYARELMSEVNALREREASIAQHPYRFAIADPARLPTWRGRARSG